MEVTFFNTPSGGAATPRYQYNCKVITSLGHEVSEDNIDADIIVIWSPISVDNLSLALKVKRMRKPLIYECYYSVIESYLDEGVIKPNSRREKVLRFLEKSMFNLADLILVDTKANQDYFSNIYTISKDKIIPIYGLIDAFVFKKDDMLKKDLDLPHPIFLYHGSFLKVHGVDTIISAFQLVVSKEKNCSLVLMGDITPKMEQRIRKRLEKTSNAILLPPVNHKMVPSYLNSIDIWLGAFGSSPKSNRTARYAMIEAMSTECAVITASTDENRNIIQDGVNGYLVPPRDPKALAKQMLFVIKEMNKQIGKNARKLVLKQFHLDSLKKIIEEQIIPVEFHPRPLLIIQFRLFMLKIGLFVKKKMKND